MDEWRLAIDYGSSHTVAVLERPDGAVRPLTFDGSTLLQSAVYAEPGGALLTGSDAVAAAQVDPARFEPYPKRQIDAGSVLLGDREVPVADMITATLRRVAEEAARVTGGAGTETVLTHPAGWGPGRRATLRTAAHDAGFAAPAMLAEPVAAARYYLDTLTPPGAPAVVFDLGGGTFDVCLVRSDGAEFEILASDGLTDLGGVDLDALVVDLVAETAKAVNPQAWARLLAPSTPPERRQFRALWDRARQAKESLSRRASVTIALPLLDREVQVTREQFERAAAPMLGLAVDQTLGLLRRAGLDAAALGGIFLVGGATRTPLVGTLLHRATGRPPTVLDQPELVVAEGALRIGPGPAAAPPAPEQPPAERSSPEQPPRTSAPPAASQAQAAARPGGASVQVRWQAPRGRALAGAAFWAAFVVCGLWFAIANSGTMSQQPTPAKVFGIGLLVACFVLSMGDLARAAAPGTLVVDSHGIHLQRLRPGRGIQRLSLAWAQIAEASVAQVDMVPQLVVRTNAGPVDGAALTGTRYRTDVSGFALCRLTEVGAPAEELRKALAAVSGGTSGGTSSA